MDPIFESDIYEEEEDQGYSIPKILVAVLLVALIVGGVIYYREHQKYKETLVYLNQERKKVSQELDAMIEKYNMAIDENGFLADELKTERDKIIKIKQNVSNLNEEDFKKMSDFRKELNDIKQTTEFVTGNLLTDEEKAKADKQSIADNTSAAVPSSPTAESAKKTTNTGQKSAKSSGNSTTTTGSINTSGKHNPSGETPKSNEENDKVVASAEEQNTEANDTGSSTETDNSNTAKENTDTEATVTKEVKEEKPVFYTLRTVDTPPTYPGCSGNAIAKKSCIIQMVRKYLYKNFNTGKFADMDDIETNKKIRIFVSFDVNKYGKVYNIKAQSKYPKLAEEAKRILMTLPSMLPGRSDGKTVDVHNIMTSMDFIKKE